MKRLKNLIILICSVFFLYSCAAVAVIGVAGVGFGAYKYIEGRLVRAYPLSYSRAWDATNSALENLDISISKSSDEKPKGNINAVRKDGKPVVVSLKDLGQGVTTIAVRVGQFGDRSSAEKVHDEIASVSGIR